MTDIVERLRLGGPNALEVTDEAAAEIERLRALVQCLLDEDPNDLVADGGVTVLDVWRKDARHALEPKP